MFRTALFHVLSRIRDGRLAIVEGDRRREFGEPSDRTVEVRVHDPRTYREIALRASIGLADSYVDGRWDCDDIPALIALGARNMAWMDAFKRRTAFVTRPWQLLGSALRPMTIQRARRDVQAHYDLSNDLYELFLDETLSYSCAVFERPDMTLREAQEAKLERICTKLELGPEDHLLEIGTGWGGLAIHAARTRGCRVTTTTISDAQREEARRRVREAGLEDLVTILGDDYRELRGRWQKVVSVEMIEAVGWRELGTYLGKCGELLADDGVFCLQAITMDERAYDIEKGTRTFANTRIFPGGFLPSLGAIVRETARRTPMRPIHLEEIGPHYARTLREWRERFEAAGAERLNALGFDERFRRLWRFYLAYMEAGFAERRIGDIQLVLAGPRFRGERELLERVGPSADAVKA